ncbi:MAG TPA: hypothetical protein VMR02_17980 [Terracidiphilus sp.]|nr:hypothetical protein [Terracidiphilus sp.]
MSYSVRKASVGFTDAARTAGRLAPTAATSTSAATANPIDTRSTVLV